MKKTIIECNRCGSICNDKDDLEIRIKVFDTEDGTENICTNGMEYDLCNHCYNRLTDFFGKIHPNGKNFKKLKK
jgi:hypothetical protein